MNLEDYKFKSHVYTAKASDIGRQINFAGIGIVWIIKTANVSLDLSNPLLLIPLILICTSLLLDFIQYLLGGVLWIGFYNKKIKDGVSDSTDIEPKSAWRAIVLYHFYFGKFVLMFAAYVFVIRALFLFF